MKPTKVQDIYKITAKRLNLPENYVKDLVEYFYQENKDAMGNLSHVIFNFTGLGRFMMRPLKFFIKQVQMEKLVEKFKDRRDDRGIMIRTELEKRYQQFLDSRQMAEDFNIYKRKQMFKHERDKEQ